MTAVLRWRPRILVAFAAVTSLAAATLVDGPGYDTARVPMQTGAIWLASNKTGQASLVDGTVGEVRARAPVAEPGASLKVAQRANSAFVADQKTGRLSRVDTATEHITRSDVVLPVSGGLVLRPAPDLLYAVDSQSGTVVPVSPDTMRPTGPSKILSEALRPDSVVVDGGGRLWAIDDMTGDLVWLADGERRTRTTGSRTGHLAVAAGLPVLVDSGRGTAELLDPETGAVTRSVRPALHDGDVVALSESSDRSRVVIANTTRRELITCAFDTGTCAEPVEIGGEGARFGPPVEVGDHAVVPDHATGRAVVVDLVDARVVTQRLLFEEPVRFELLTRDGMVFFNDATSDRAGVLELDGEIMTITKYTETPAGDDQAPPKTDPRVQAEQITRTGLPERKPGLGIERQTAQPAQPDPGPAAQRAFISITPGNRGEVGSEFELTLTLLPAVDADIRWLFGDGTANYGSTVRNTWYTPGTYTVEALATLDSGKKALATTVVTVDPVGAPLHIARLSVQRPKPVVGEQVHFSADASGNPDSWSWTVTAVDQRTPVATAGTAAFGHRFTAPGRYTVSLTIGRGGRTATYSQELTVARGAVEGWGGNLWGQLNIPPAAKSGVIAIAAGGGHNLALKADGSVVAWGSSNTYGELDLPPETSNGVIAVAAGEMHGLALKANGTVIGWGGRNMFGQGVVPPAAQSEVVAIAAGRDHSLALKKDGSVIAWGYGLQGQTTVPSGAKSGVIAISGGGSHSTALKSDGSVIVWGGDSTEENPVTEVPAAAATGVVAIASESSSCLALKSDGSVIGWGSDAQRQISVPPAAKSGVVAISSFFWHVLALKADGSVVAWGTDLFGDGTTRVPPQYGSGVLAVAAGKLYSLVLV
jgi:PKD repeat protein